MKPTDHTSALRPMAESPESPERHASGGPDRRLARGSRLLASYGALDESAERMNRVRRALLSAPDVAPVPWLRPPPIAHWLPRPAVALALLLGATAVAGATVGRGPIGRAVDQAWQVWQRLGMAPSAPPPARSARPMPGSTSTSASTSASEPQAVAAQPAPAVERPGPLPAAPPVTPAMPHTFLAPGSGSSAPPVRAVAARGPRAPVGGPYSDGALAAIPAAEADLAHSGMKALRTDHDPARASALLERYLRTYPEGALVEETMALWIQAARQHDPARAALVAATYRRKFPTGRWIHEANAALAAAPR